MFTLYEIYGLPLQCERSLIETVPLRLEKLLADLKILGRREKEDDLRLRSPSSTLWKYR